MAAEVLVTLGQIAWHALSCTPCKMSALVVQQLFAVVDACTRATRVAGVATRKKARLGSPAM
jgi:hypothetical protein